MHATAEGCVRPRAGDFAAKGGDSAAGSCLQGIVRVSEKEEEEEEDEEDGSAPVSLSADNVGRYAHGKLLCFTFLSSFRKTFRISLEFLI